MTPAIMATKKLSRPDLFNGWPERECQPALNDRVQLQQLPWHLKWFADACSSPNYNQYRPYTSQEGGVQPTMKQIDAWYAEQT
mgnify:CR=1 FL=1